MGDSHHSDPADQEDSTEDGNLAHQEKEIELKGQIRMERENQLRVGNQLKRCIQ